MASDEPLRADGLPATDDWHELGPQSELPRRAAEFERYVSSTVSRDDLFGLLVTDAELGIRVVAEPRLAPSDGPLEQMVGRTRLFIDRRRLTDLQWDAATFVGVLALANSVTFSAAAALFQKAVRTVKLLDEAELDATIVLAALSGGDPYSTAVAESDIIGQYDGDARRAVELLQRLAKKGVAEKVGTDWRLVW